MTSTSRDRRLELQAKDWGDPEETVYVGETVDSRSYHTDEDCMQFTVEPVAMDRAEAQRKWKAPCRKCVPLREVAP
jgi:hypothetical protein